MSALEEERRQFGVQPSNRQSASDSQTASEFIDSQLQLEADAREALPFSFDRCTQLLGPLKQSLFSCLTCNPSPTIPTDPYTPAGVCYACSIACHGEHTLVELFNKRNFTCDCGTTRLPMLSPCTLRIDPATGVRGPVHSQPAAEGNTYNQNFRNRFCGCGELYDPHMQKGTMYQCLGLATEEDGGCGEDWWHPECLLGLPHDWYSCIDTKRPDKGSSCADVDTNKPQETSEDQDHPVPPGFPDEDNIEALICYKCTSTAPWIKQYGGTNNFTALTYQEISHSNRVVPNAESEYKPRTAVSSEHLDETPQNATNTRKRKAEEDVSDSGSSSPKKLRAEPEDVADQKPAIIISCARVVLPTPPIGSISLVACNENFRTSFCRCPECYALIRNYPQLLEEEEIYEPPLSEDGENGEGGNSVGTGSLLDRGEAALSNVDRVRAIEGVMVYNHLKDKVKSFLQPFAESGQAVGAEDIKAYFEKLRGDAEAIRAAGGAALAGGDSADGGGDNRREQSGF